MRNITKSAIRLLPSLLLLLFFTTAQGQIRFAPDAATDFSYRVENVQQTAPNKLEFDVYLVDTDAGQAFEYASGQYGFTLNGGIHTGGTLSAVIDNSGSDLNSSQQFVASPSVAYLTGAYAGTTLIRLAGKSPPGAGQGTIISTVSPGTKTTHFVITSTVPFVAGSQANLAFTSSTSGNPLYATRCSYYAGTTNTALVVTSGVNAIVNGNPILNPVPTAFNVTGGGSYCAGGAGLPVGLEDSEADVTYELWLNGAATGTTVAGTGEAITFGNQTVGTYTIKGTNGGGTTAMTGSATISEQPIITPTFTQLGPYDQNGTPDALPGTSIEGITGSWNPAAISTAAVGVAVYDFTPDGGQCANATSMSITVNAVGPITYTWNGANTSWTTSSNWTPNGIPGSADDVIIPGGLGLNYPVIANATTIANLTIQNGGALMGNSNLTVTGSTQVDLNLAGDKFQYTSTPTSYPTALSVFNGETYLRRYDVPTGMWVNLTGADALVPGKGYSTKNASPQTAHFTGVLNSGFVTPAMANGGVGDGWNLIGNPYCSSYELDGAGVSSDIQPIAYFWNSATNQYANYNWATSASVLGATQYVPLGQGFFVKSVGPSPVLSFSESLRTFNTHSYYKSTLANSIRLTLAGEEMMTEALVMFDENASALLDNNYDAYLLKASEINFLYTKSTEGHELSVNVLTSPEVNAVVPVYMDVVKSGTYTITASELESLTYALPVWLTDNKTGMNQNLVLNPVYTFTAEKTDSPSRFKLSFGSVGIDDMGASTIGIYSERKNIHIVTPETFNGNVLVYDMLGKLVAERRVNGGKTVLAMNVVDASYVVKVTSNDTAVTRKIILN